MRVVINAQLDPERSGGIGQVLIGLAHGLGQLDGEDEYLFVCSPQSAPWLHRYIGSNSRIRINTRSTPSPARGVRASDGFWESFKPDVLHFPYQSYTATAVPSVFNPHDMQHVHLPEYFSQEERERRDTLYGEACRLASAVALTSRFVKDDIVRHYSIEPDKVHVIWWGPPTEAYRRCNDQGPEAALQRSELSHRNVASGLPRDFAIYPAQTWPHKNHENLLRALHWLRQEHGEIVPLVCTGTKTEHYDRLAALVDELELADQVWFLGHVREDDLMELYKAARLMVVPTFFEAISFPVFEAFDRDIPVACSNVTSLPEQVGDAAIVFDPHEVEQIGSAILRLHRDAVLRQSLIERGRARVQQFSWRSTAEQYHALYRQLAGHTATSTSPAKPAHVPSGI